MRALYQGPALVVARGDDEYFASTPNRLGVPLAETIDGSHAGALLDTLHRTWSEATPQRRLIYREGVWGTLLAIPVWRDGRLWGVAAEWQPALPSAPVAPRPRRAGRRTLRAIAAVR